jgi:hypothetical protein
VEIYANRYEDIGPMNIEEFIEQFAAGVDAGFIATKKYFGC